MSNVKLRTEIKKAIDRIAPERLESLADYVTFLACPSIAKRLAVAEKAVASAKGVRWRKVRSDV